MTVLRQRARTAFAVGARRRCPFKYSTVVVLRVCIRVERDVCSRAALKKGVRACTRARTHKGSGVRECVYLRK